MAKITDEDDAQFLNDALRAYINTFPREDNLKSFLQDKDMVSQLCLIKEKLDASVKAAEDCLYGEKDGVTWDQQFEEKLFRQIKLTCPWLSYDGYGSLKSFSGWLCWHEGLEA